MCVCVCVCVNIYAYIYMHGYSDKNGIYVQCWQSVFFSVTKQNILTGKKYTRNP